GANLFHSFSDFNVLQGQSATFTSNFAGATDNVISRVTGGNASTINGLLRSEVAGADFWLINPNGLVFGAEAVLDVPAGFHASTADVLELADGGSFRATDPGASSLTIAPPSAFGFLDATVGTIAVNGSQLSVGAGESLALVGGRQTLTNASLAAPSGRVDLVGVASAGSVATTAGVGGVLGVSGFDAFADIDLSASTVSVSTAGGTDAGAIGVVGQFVTLLSGSSLLAETASTGNGGSIAVEAGTGGLGLLQASRVSVSSLSTAAGAGDAGQITIAGDQVFVEDSAVLARGRAGEGGSIEVDANFVTVLGGSIQSESTDIARSGSVDIEGSLTVAPDGSVRAGDVVSVSGDSVSLFQGRIDAMDIRLAVNSLSMNAGSAMGGTSGTAQLNLTGVDGGIAEFVSLFDESFIAAETTMTAKDISLGDNTSIGVAGAAIVLNVDRLFLSSGGSISVGSRDGIDGGTVLIRGASADAAELVSIRGVSSSGRRSSVDTGAGVNPFIDDSTTGGPITIIARSLELTDEGRITSLASSLGSGGDILLQVDSLTMDRGAVISSGTGAFGDAGDITIRGATAPAAALVALEGGDGENGTGIFSASTFRDAGPGGPQGVAGAAGNISITADEIRLSSTQFGIPLIDASTVEGPGGSISLGVGTLTVSGGFIQAFTTGPGDAGSISIAGTDGGAADLIVLNFLPSDITTSSLSNAEDAGDAGAISIAAREIQVRGGASISSETSGGGAGGSIGLQVDELILAGEESRINVSTRGSGDAGDVEIDGLDGAPVSRIEISGLSAGVSSSSARIFGSPADLGDAGNISIRADSLSLTGLGQLAARTDGGAGGTIDIAVRTLSVTDGASIDARATADGDAGDIVIQGVDGGRADSVVVAGISESGVGNVSARITSSSGGAGPDAGAAGNIDIASELVTIADGGFVSGETVDGQGGTIELAVGTLTLTGGSIRAATLGTGNAGSIAITGFDGDAADRVELGGFPSEITSSSVSSGEDGGDAGTITIAAREIAVLQGSRIASDTFGGGDGGSIAINVDDLSLVGLESSIAVGTISSGNAGNIVIDGIDGAAANSVLLSGEGAAIRSDATRIFGSPAQIGAAGSIAIRADSVTLEDLAQVSVLTSGSSGGAIDFGVETLAISGGAGIDARTLESGDAGDISIHGIDGGRASEVTITGVSDRPNASGTPSRISSASQGTGPGAGAAGNISIAAESVIVSDGGVISAATLDGQGGAISMDVGQLTIADGGTVTTAVSGAGTGGSIGVVADGMVLLDAGRMIADSSAAGPSGSISVTADELRLENGAALSVRST
ncbi:MAG TPA: filamentous hemagglutinin N-terminal domain-containing protein, partial [Candidatus Polarisedimenticolaceae bacterium]|nr:filamentous hemagglutinin N-terminal domain-containing protein [Candidatus Polarisedimenticolaceae bacterium]